MDRRVKYQQEHRDNGLCISCPEPLAKGSKAYCVSCLKVRRKKDRERTGFKPWKRGGRGRPPLSAKAKEGVKQMRAEIQCPMCGKINEYDTDNETLLCVRCGELIQIEDA